MVLDFRTSPAILNYVNGAEVGRYATQGVVTPDHTIRTKNYPLIVGAAAEAGSWTISARRRAKPLKNATSPTTRPILPATTQARRRRR